MLIYALLREILPFLHNTQSVPNAEIPVQHTDPQEKDMSQTTIRPLKDMKPSDLELTAGHNISLLGRKSGACLFIEIQDGSLVVRTQDLVARLTPTTSGVVLETEGEVLIGRPTENDSSTEGDE